MAKLRQIVTENLLFSSAALTIVKTADSRRILIVVVHIRFNSSPQQLEQDFQVLSNLHLTAKYHSFGSDFNSWHTSWNENRNRETLPKKDGLLTSSGLEMVLPDSTTDSLVNYFQAYFLETQEWSYCISFLDNLPQCINPQNGDELLEHRANLQTSRYQAKYISKHKLTNRVAKIK